MNWKFWQRQEALTNVRKVIVYSGGRGHELHATKCDAGWVVTLNGSGVLLQKNLTCHGADSWIPVSGWRNNRGEYDYVMIGGAKGARSL